MQELNILSTMAPLQDDPVKERGGGPAADQRQEEEHQLDHTKRDSVGKLFVFYVSKPAGFYFTSADD
jgi:hypothetical protein